MKKKICLIFFLILLIGSVVAQENVFKASDGDNWLGRIISSIKFSIFKSGTFSVYGDTLKCSTSASSVITLKNGQSKTITTSNFGTGQGFVNWFRGSPYNGQYPDHTSDSRQYLGESWVGSSWTWTCDAGAYWNNDCYIDLYNCPKPCYSDSECGSGKTCDKSVLSAKIPNAGVCIAAPYTHQTQVYRCSNGVKTNLGKVSYGDVNFCTNPSATKYLIGSTDQCLTYEPTECQSTPECSSGQTKCEGTVYFTCSGGNWLSQGQVNGQCGYTTPIVKGDIRLEQGKTWEVVKSTSGKKVIFRIPLKNYGTATEAINLEAGFYSSSYAQDIAKLYSIYQMFSSVAISSCNPYEEFVITKQVILSPGSTETIEIEVDPEKAFATYSIGTHNLNSEPLIAFFGLYKKCLGGYINEAGTTGMGVMFDYKEFSKICPLLLNINIFCGSENIGTCKSSTLTLTKECSIPLTSEVICNSDADLDCNGIIDRAELGTYIDKWISNQVTREKLGQVIQAWSETS